MSSVILKQEVLLKQKSRSKKHVYLGFFVVYFSLSLSFSYLTVYLPIYLLGIINVNRSGLALIQVFTYSFLFLAPIFALIYDKFYAHRRKVMIILMFFFILSFLGTVSLFSVLYLFGFLLGLNLFSHEAIKVGMGRLIVESSLNDAKKDTILIVINISSNLGGYLPPLLFLLIVSDIYNLDLWTNFFLIGGISLIPLILSVFLQNFKSNIGEDKKEVKVEKKSSKFYYYQMIILTLSYIMIWSDKIYSYPFGNWMLSKFGAEGINLYSMFFVIFLLLNTIGSIAGKVIAIRLTRKKIIIVTNSIFICLIILMAFSTNIIFLFIILSLNWLVSGIMLLNYISLHIDFCKKVRYQTVSYQFLRVGVAIASTIFIPLGTFLSSLIATETLFLFAAGLCSLSLIPLFFIKS